MLNKGKVKSSIKELYNQLLEMDAPTTRRLYDLAYSAIHPAFLQKVIEELPLTLEESNIYAQLCASVPVAVLVKDMCKARLKGLGAWNKDGQK